MWQDFPIERLDGDFCHIGYVRTSVVVLQKDAITSIRSLLMNRFVESMHLLNVEICIDRLVVRKKFIVNDTFPIPPHTASSSEDEVLALLAVLLVYWD